MQHGDDETDFDCDLQCDCDCDESDEAADDDDDYMYLLGVNLVKHFPGKTKACLVFAKDF